MPVNRPGLDPGSCNGGEKRGVTPEIDKGKSIDRPNEFATSRSL